MIKGIRHVGIRSWDIAEQYQFFYDLGLRHKSDEMEPAETIKKYGIHDYHLLTYPDMNVIKFDNGIELLKGRPNQLHIALDVVNIEKVFQNVIDGKHLILSEGIIENEKVKVFFCQGPDGIIYEMVEEKDLFKEVVKEWKDSTVEMPD